MTLRRIMLTRTSSTVTLGRIRAVEGSSRSTRAVRCPHRHRPLDSRRTPLRRNHKRLLRDSRNKNQRQPARHLGRRHGGPGSPIPGCLDCARGCMRRAGAATGSGHTRSLRRRLRACAFRKPRRRAHYAESPSSDDKRSSPSLKPSGCSAKMNQLRNAVKSCKYM